MYCVRRQPGVLLLLLVSMALPALCSGQTAPDTGRLRALFFQRDYETAVQQADSVEPTAARDRSEFQAWYLLNLARSGRDEEAVKAAREVRDKNPRDGWAWFALAGALNEQGDDRAAATDAAGHAVKLLRGRADALWMYAEALGHDPERRAEAVRYVDRQRSKVASPSQLLVTRAVALFQLAEVPRLNAEKAERALEGFNLALGADPRNVDALYFRSFYLTAMHRADEALPLTQKALALAPGSVDVHQMFWRAAIASRSSSAEQARQLVLDDIRAYLRQHGDRPGALRAIAAMAREMKAPQEQETAEGRILERFSDTPEAESVLAARWRQLGPTPDSQEKAGYRQSLRDFIARPRHYRLGLLGEAYLKLFTLLANDRAADGDELLRAVNGMVKYDDTNTYTTRALGPIALADRKIFLSDAERIARDGIPLFRSRLEPLRASVPPGEFERMASRNAASGHDALGWVLFAQGRNEEAEQALLESYELDHESRANLEHLGRFYEARNNIPRAEQYYIKGLTAPGRGTNPCEASLRALFERKTGGTAGFEAYVQDLSNADGERRRARILAERLAAPERVPPFTLKSLDGHVVSLDNLRGKVVAINFWGMWCSWCVAELPEYQKLFEKYANDPSVAILTADNDENRHDILPWMTARTFTFPVLLDDGYVVTAGVTSFPTTWFLDGGGRKVFEKAGWSEKLLEEFSWRIEAIRGDK